MRAMFLVTDTRRGGAPNRCAAIVTGMAERGWDQLVVSVMPSGSVCDDLHAAGISTAELALESWRGLPTAVHRLRRLARDWKPDVLQTSLWHANVLGRVGLAGMGIPVVETFEGVHLTKTRAQILVDRATSRLATRHVAVSQDVAEVASRRDGVAREDITVIPFGIDVDAWSPAGSRTAARAALGIAPDAVVVGWVGRLHPVKDLLTLMRAVGSLPNWWLVAAGRGDLGPQLGDWAADAGLAGRFRFAGELADVRPVLDAADVFALSSLTEAMPLALVEAMAAGLPVVAPRVGGIPEIVTDSHDGLLVPPGDRDALRAALLEASKRPELGRQARETVRSRLSRGAMLDAYDGLWRQVIDRRPRQPRLWPCGNGRPRSRIST